MSASSLVHRSLTTCSTKAIVHQLSQDFSASGAFLDALRVHWPSGDIIDVAELSDSAPVEEPPLVTDAMSQSGRCTDAMLY